MTYPLTISEEERRSILGSYDLEIDPTIIRERIESFRFTSDMKYVVFENQFYSTETGELMPLTERWSVSDVLHTIGDVASMGMDFIIPGSGAIVDTINATSYVIEALFHWKNTEKRNKLLLMGAITFAFVAIPGPLQSVAVPMKRFVKYGAKKAIAKPVLKGLEIIYKNLGKVLSAIPNLIKRAVDSRLGSKVLGKMGKRISKHMGVIINGIKGSFDDVIKRARESVNPDKVMSKAEKEARAMKKLRKKTNKGILKTPARMARRGSKILSVFGFRGLTKFFDANLASKLSGELSRKLLRKLGFGRGGTYRYVSQTASKGRAWSKLRTVKILDTKTGGVLLKDMKNGQEFFVSNAHFINQAVGAPWGRRGRTRFVPFFIKRLSNFLLPDGSVDTKLLDELPDLSISQTSKESLEYLRDEISDTKPEKNVPTRKTAPKPKSNPEDLFREGLNALGYTGNLNQAIKQFQKDNELEDTDGTMNRVTAKELAIELRKKRINKDLQLKLFNL